MVFYSSNLSLLGARSLNYLEVFAKGVIPYPGSSQVITGKKNTTPQATLSSEGENPRIASSPILHHNPLTL